MRAGAGFNADGESPLPSSSGSSSGVAHSAWRSPVPYVFGGLAATLGVIALALFVLACSYYWNLDSGDVVDDKPRDADDSRRPVVLEDRFIVIMPGDAAPTVLAIPIAKRAAAVDSSSSSNNSNSDLDNQQLTGG
ncbi:protein GLUTAMINE DUMPER 3-like [Curcuma longa]|uniref:protein GLUTAMINE DUMPER 3-like n=1 Tax=Curcuma longa TaxID=136217 RepID=UPI003D9FA01F